ncbi:MAG: DHHW family protein [Lachnospiraceae bacterium]
MEKKSAKIVWIAVLACILLLSTGLLFLPKKEYSEQENRYLEQFPKLTLTTIRDGSFMQDFETYVCDHFPLRDAFMTVRTWYERLTGKNQVGGIYLCKDGYFIEEYRKPENTERIISAFTRLEQKVEHADVTFLLAPTAVTVYADRLPAHAKNASQTEEMARIYAALASKTVDVTEALLEKKEEYQLYYRLDHHWTTYGAYVAYAEYCKAKGMEPLGMDCFTPTVVSEDFQGTIYSKLNDRFAGTDEITVFAQEGLSLSVRYLDTDEVSDSLYAPKYLKEKDEYSYFLNNIHPMIEIINETTDSEDVLVLIKDSYANCMVPFLVNHYRKIYVVDTRYYKESVSTFINENAEVTDVLVLYNMNTIDTDLGIGGIY